MRREFGKQFVLIFVDMSDPKVRFERLKSRNEARDPQAWDQFLKQNEEEEQLFSLSKTRVLANYIIYNDNGLEQLYKKTDEIAKKNN